MCAYANTINKTAIRRHWDLPILDHWRRDLRRPLTYFGLPGPEIHDLLDWQNVIGARSTGVEEAGRNKKERLVADEACALLRFNVDFHGIPSPFQLLRGAIEDILMNGYDVYGNSPQMNDGAPVSHRRFRYDLVNLDFDGGLGYPDKDGGARRVSAIKKLFDRQQGTSFVLLLTINVRDQLGEEVEEFLVGMQARDWGPGWHEMIDWHRARGDGEREHKLKATVPSFVRSIAEGRMFEVTCRPPIAYDGHESAHMLHFVFELHSRSGNLRTFGKQDDRNLVMLPLLRVCQGSIQFATNQHPFFDRDEAVKSLNFLPAEIQTVISQSLSG